MEITNLNDESPEYRSSREALLEAEIELMAHRERVARLRRQLPGGPAVENYEFLEGPEDLGAGDGPVRGVQLQDLFSGPDRPLIVYHLMYGKSQTTPCPMCTSWIDGFNGIAHHLEQNADLAIVAAAELPALRAHARDRGWHRLRLLSCADNTFKLDLGSETEDGAQDSQISVFTLDPGGPVRHFYSAHPWMSAEIKERGIDLLNPVWHLLDLTPSGRKEWYAGLDYGS